MEGAERISESPSHTGKSMNPMCFSNLKFAPSAIRCSGELQIQHIGKERPVTDEELAAHLAAEAGRLLVAQRQDSDLSGAALGRAADRVANDFILAGLAEWRPDDAILSEES